MFQFAQNLKTHFWESLDHKLALTNNEILLKQTSDLLKRLKTSYSKVDHYQKKLVSLKKSSNKQSQALLNVSRPKEYLKLNAQILRNESKLETQKSLKSNLCRGFWNKFELGLQLNYWAVNSIERNFLKAGWGIYNEFLTKNFTGFSRALKNKHYKDFDLMEIVRKINPDTKGEN